MRGSGMVRSKYLSLRNSQIHKRILHNSLLVCTLLDQPVLASISWWSLHACYFTSNMRRPITNVFLNPYAISHLFQGRNGDLGPFCELSLRGRRRIVEGGGLNLFVMHR